MNELVYPRERTLSKITIVLGLLLWLALLIGTFGTALLGLLAGFVLYLLLQSALIAHIKGNGVELSETQFPDLHAQFISCCDRLQMTQRPQVYILNGNGCLNAFATRFLGAQFVVLLSNVVDAMEHHTDGVRFYLGHELGHLRMRHLTGQFFRWPALWLPLLGAAYSRARETTCDRHGLACSGSPEGAARALAALSAGAERWKQLDMESYLRQANETSGFWMSLHELTAGYPWLTKRAARVMDPNAPMPRRNRFAYVLAALIPHTGLGMGFGLLMLFYFVFILGTVALPAYQNFMAKTTLTAAFDNSRPAREALAKYYLSTKTVPDSLKTVGIASALPDGSQLILDSEDMVLLVHTNRGELILTPTVNPQGHLTWDCASGGGVKPEQLPAGCHK